MISLCLAGLSVAAPQLGFDSRSATDQEGIVSDVVTALGPSIAEAVANALAAQAAQEEAARQAAQAAAEAAAARRAEAARQEAARQAAAEAERLRREEEERRAFEEQLAREQAAAGGNAQYTFGYKVRDDTEGTFIYQDENRNGALVTGEYGYIDPFGSLVKVNYQADENGYQQSVDQEKDFLRSGGQTAVAVSPPRVAPRPAPRRPAVDQSALIAQIVAALTPQINSAVESTLASAGQQQTVTRTVSSSSGDRLEPLFGRFDN